MRNGVRSTRNIPKRAFQTLQQGSVAATDEGVQDIHMPILICPLPWLVYESYWPVKALEQHSV